MIFGKKSKRKVFESSRNDCSDDDFLHHISIPYESRHIALSLRRTMACQCGIAPEKIRADDPPNALLPLLNEFFDEACFILVLMETHGASLNLEGLRVPQLFDYRCFWWKKKGSTSFGEWVEKFINEANKRLETTFFC